MSLLIMSTNPPSNMDRLSPSWIRRSMSRSKSPQEPKQKLSRSNSMGLLSPRTNSSKTNSTSDTTSASSGRSIKKRPSFRGMVNRLRSSSSASSLGGAATQETDFNDIHDWFHGFQAYARLVTTQISPASTHDSAEFTKPTKTLSKNCGGTLIHGLPEATFDLSLLWCPASTLSKRENTTSPSWSWTSYTGGVNFPFDPTTSPDTYTLPRSENELFRSEILHYHTGPLSDPYTIRREKSSSLRIKYPPYFHAPRGTSVSNEDSTSLRFTASAISADNFSLEQLHYQGSEIPISHLLNAAGTHCGVLMDYESNLSTPSSTGPYEFILLSRTRRPDPAAHTRRPRNPVMHPPGTPIWAGDAFVWDEEVEDFDESVFEKGEWKMLNVMLIRWVGEKAERVAVGRIHEDEWVARGAERREVVLC